MFSDERGRPMGSCTSRTGRREGRRWVGAALPVWLMVVACGSSAPAAERPTAPDPTSAEQPAEVAPTPEPAPEPPPPPAEEPLPPVLARTTVPIEDGGGYRASLDVTWYETEVADGAPAAFDCASSVANPVADAKYRPTDLSRAAIRVVRVDVTLEPQTVGGFTWDPSRTYTAELAIWATTPMGMQVIEDTTQARYPCTQYVPQKSPDTTYSIAWYGMAEKSPNAPEGDWPGGTGGRDMLADMALSIGMAPDCGIVAADGFVVDQRGGGCRIAPEALAG